MTNEEFDKKWNKRYKERVTPSHDKPSPETIRRFNEVDKMLKEIVEILKELTKKNCERPDKQSK